MTADQSETEDVGMSREAVIAAGFHWFIDWTTGKVRAFTSEAAANMAAFKQCQEIIENEYTGLSISVFHGREMVSRVQIERLTDAAPTRRGWSPVDDDVRISPKDYSEFLAWRRACADRPRHLPHSSVLPMTVTRSVPKDEYGVHEAHCCIAMDHGCKYGDKRCPVVLGLTTRTGPGQCQNGRDLEDPPSMCLAGTPKEPGS